MSGGPGEPGKSVSVSWGLEGGFCSIYLTLPDFLLRATKQLFIGGIKGFWKPPVAASMYPLLL